jgi:hypothetical protein
MPLTAPEFSLQVGAPHVEGLRTQFSLARDWRCYAEGRAEGRGGRGEKCPWELRAAEYIEPLRAIAPAALVYPRDMDWTVQTGKEDRWRTGSPDWAREATSFIFVDGAVYAAGQSLAAGAQLYSPEALDYLVPRFALWLDRKPPPVGQGVFVGVAVNVPALYTVAGSEEPARLTMVLPLMQQSDEDNTQWDEPFLHLMLESEIGVYSGGTYFFATEGEIISRGPKSTAMRQGGGREGWLFEYEEDADLYDGGHIIIRNVAQDGADWWHYHDRNLRVVSTAEAVAAGATWSAGAWVIRCQGAVTVLNLSPVHYGDNVGRAWARTPLPLPHEIADNDVEADAWADDSPGEFGCLATVPANWTVTVAGHEDGTRRPAVTFTRGGDPYGEDYNNRPVLWFVTETHRAVIADADETPRTDTNTPGVHRCVNVRWTWGEDYKGSAGEAEFTPELEAYYEDWRENANVILRLGWGAGAGAGLEVDEYAQGYILPGGLPRGRDGNTAHGDPLFGPVRFGGFDVARLPQKDVLDVRQAGGMTAGEWGSMLGDALGIAAARVYVDPTVADQVIPPHEIPSLPALAPRDGGSWEAHITEVERAANLRVCWSRDVAYDLWIDGGPPEYEDGVSEIALEIDYHATEDADKLFEASHSATVAGFRNVLKAVCGPEDKQVVYYWSETLAERKAGVGDDWPRVIEQEDAEIGELRELFLREHHGRGTSVLRWTMPMRPDLRPDMFVKVTDCPGMGIGANAVYRILTHTLSTQTEEVFGTSTLEAVLVYTPEGGPYY